MDGMASPSYDDVFGPPCVSELNGVKNGTSPSRDLVRTSSRSSTDSRKGKLAEYFCGLKVSCDSYVRVYLQS